MDMPEVLNIRGERSDQKPEKVTLTLAIAAGLDVFDGHFDGAPIVPGVVQINWALKLANRHLCALSPLAISHMEAVKFQQVMLPGSELELDLTLNANKLYFDFHSAEKRYSSGRVVISS